MKIYFLRHATATDDAPTDAARELTKEGRKEARVAGLALAQLGSKPEAIFSSPLIRARQTSELAAQALEHGKKVVILDQLKNGFTTLRLLEALQPFARLKEIVLVGHRPSFPRHIAALTGLDHAEGLRLGKGAIACVSIESLNLRAGELRWLMGQKVLRLLLPTRR